jgi:hypothetical protein
MTAIAPTRICFLNLWSMPWNQFPKILAILHGGYKAKANIDLAKKNWKNNFFILSCQNTHFLLSCQFRFVRLSFVRITPFRRYQPNTLVFKGIFNFQSFMLLSTGTSGWINVLYVEWTENLTFAWRFQRNSSDPSCSCTLAKHWSNAL